MRILTGHIVARNAPRWARAWDVVLSTCMMVLIVLVMGGVFFAYTAASSVAAEPAPIQQVTEVYRLPHAPGAFTQGLFFVGERLFETTGRHGQSRMMELDPRTGEMLRTHFLPARYFGEGATAMGPHVVWLTWTRQQAFIFDLESLEASGEFSYRGEGWGLASDGDRFMMSDGSSVISFRDPQTFVRHGEVQVTDGGVAVERLNELEWVSGVLYANVWRDSRIAVIDIRTGNVVRWLDLAPFHPPLDDPAAVLNGIAYDQRNDCLLVTGKLWPEMICVRPVH